MGAHSFLIVTFSSCKLVFAGHKCLINYPFTSLFDTRMEYHNPGLLLAFKTLMCTFVRWFTFKEDKKECERVFFCR